MDRHEDREHALYAPSAMHRTLNCHGSVAASEGLDTKESQYAEEGTECHEAAAKVLAGEEWAKATKGLTEEQEWIVEEYTDYCLDLISDLIEKFGKDGVKVWIETRVRSANNKNNHGTADLCILAGRTLAVIDLKAGYIEVELGTAENPNPQLANYGFMALDEHSLWSKVDKVRLTIVQPRVREKPQTLVITPAELRRFAAKVDEAIDIIESGDTTRTAGTWCKYCPAKGRCSTLREYAVAKAKVTFDNPKPLRNYAPEELISILDEAEIIQAHIDGARAHVMNELEKGRLKGMGWKLVPKRPYARWIDFEAVVKKLVTEWGAHESLAYKPKALTPGQLEKELKNAGIKFDISPYFEKTSSGPTLAREDDKREEFKRDVFGDEK